MTNSMKVKIKKKPDTIAQYVKIPRDIVMDSSYPFDRNAELQIATIRIDEKTKSLIIQPLEK